MPRILVVENEPDIRRLLVFVLERAGHEVASAEHGAEALRHLRHLPPDLLLLDLERPVMDGRTLLAEMRRTAAWQDIPVVLVSVRPDTAAVAKELGAVGHLIKPIRSGELRDLVQRVTSTP